jgi:hypothetical protein
MKISAGKYYKTRDGTECFCRYAGEICTMIKWVKYIYHVKDDGRFYVHKNGDYVDYLLENGIIPLYIQFGHGHHLDIVEELMA